ncbi:hypothetical protein EJ08DRAFT_60783 [Tothia fuscella]|uniref:Uncharacterized protein n=1 Tax=Tothia fuscella TaxID=1048955 RepID=A0A9P4NWG2_9PEZI|nr:hypothetical protein EJ08DRAFT_60783 [Tothia fuscella]
MSRHLSPTAQLLRSSRVFSIPPPLPRPGVELGDRQGFRRSDTATLPYPTRQAIDASASSRFHGDWGLKRALPKRPTTTSSGTTLRLTAIDTTERITDYESSSDFTKTLDKFQELGLAIESFDDTDTIAGYRVHSAFNPDFDYTDKDTAPPPSNNTYEPPNRWKYSGPNIEALTDSEFQAYVAKKVQTRKGGFKEYLDNLNYKRHIQIEMKSTLHQMRNARGADNAAQAARDARETHARQQFLEWLHRISVHDFRAIVSSYQSRSANDQAGLDSVLTEWLNQLTQDEIQARHEVYTRIQLDIIANSNGTLRGSKSASLEASLSLSRTSVEVLEMWWASAQGDRPMLQPIPAHLRSVLFVESQLGTKHTLEEYREKIRCAHRAEREFLQHFSLSDFNTSLDDGVKVLRADTTSNSKLNKTIREYLDIRPVKSLITDSAASRKLGGPAHDHGMSTHPAAGLSYLRTNSILENHPILGPQANRTPAQARVLTPRSQDANRSQAAAVLGIAGIAVKPPADSRDVEALSNLQLNTPGGAKTWWQVQGAHIDWEGRIQLQVAKPQNQNGQLISEGHLYHPHPRPGYSRLPSSSTMMSPPAAAAALSSGSYARFKSQLDKRPKENPTNAKLRGLLNGNTRNRPPPASYPTS